MGSHTSGFGRHLDSAQAGGSLRAAEPGRSATEATLPPVGVIINPKSHRNKRLSGADLALPGVTTVLPRTKAEIVETLHKFADSRIGVLAIGGGDGTIRDVLTRAAPIFGEDWPDIAILPQGKTNALAHDLGVPNKWSLRSALDAARRGRTVERRPLIVEGRNGQTRTRYGFLLGAGVFNAAIEAGQVAHRHGAFQGLAIGMTVAFGLIQALCGVGEGPWRRQYAMRLADASTGEELPFGDHGHPAGRFLAGFTTLGRFPLGISPFREADGNGPIRYFMLDAPLRRAIALFPAAMFGYGNRHFHSLGMHRGSGETFDIELGDGFILDGEIFPPGAFRVSAGPPMRFVTP